VAVKKSATSKAPAPAKKPVAVKRAAPAKKAVPVEKPVSEKKSRPAVRSDESAWTAAELREIERELREDAGRLAGELAAAEAGLADLIRDSGDGAGDDQADAGSKTFEREHEMSLANNARDMLLQVEHALARLANGTYGACENCGTPIGKGRLQAFPRATLCLPCKQAEER
jgi:RNA polymerase-binding protein DksA